MSIDHIYDPQATTIPVLRYLVAVAEEGHFGRAAERCRVSQPTLSAQISRWEERLGLRVFERDQRGARVSVAGEPVVAAARAALAALRAVEEAAEESQPPFHGPLRLGLIPTVAPQLLPLALPALETRWPGLRLPVAEAETRSLLADLREHRLDVAILAEVPGLDALERVALYDEAFVLATPPGHPLLEREPLRPADLARERLLLLDEGHCLRDQAVEFCRLQGAVDRPGAEVGASSLATLRALVAAGHGVTLLPALGADAGDGLALRPLPQRSARRRIVAVWRRSDPRAEAYRTFATVIAGAVPERPPLVRRRARA